MKVSAVGALVLEARRAIETVQQELGSAGAGAVSVSGMLAEQLAKQLGAGAAPGAVVVTEGPTVGGARAVVRVIAGDPNEEDVALVEAADRAGIPVVLVQLWPQADWRAPFVLTPFVVECKTGEGFPVETIASLIARAVEHPAPLAARIPVLRDPVATGVERASVVRAALLGFLGAKSGATRPLLAAEQVNLLGQLLALEPPEKRSEELPLAVGIGGVALAAGFALRSLARGARGRLPAPLADALVAAAGTWALAEAVKRLDAAGLAEAASARLEKARS